LKGSSKLPRKTVQFALRHADAAIALLITILGLAIFAFTGIGCLAHANCHCMPGASLRKKSR